MPPASLLSQNHHNLTKGRDEMTDDGKTISKLEDLMSSARQRVDDKAEELRGRMLDLARDLTREAQRLTRPVVLSGAFGVNSLGVIQSQGYTIDRLCGELRVAQEALIELEHAHRQLTEGR
jgi:hypothetical protein